METKDYVEIKPRGIQFPRASFLTETQQQTYEEACKQFKGEKARASLAVPIQGSNLWKVLFLNQIGIRTASLSELDAIAEQNPDFLRRTYEDAPAVVLRSAGDSHAPNSYLAKSLANLIKKTNFDQPYVIEGLELREDANSDYGLSFKKGNQFKAIQAPAFNHSNHQKTFSKVNSDYSIDFDDNSPRTLYTRDDGASGLVLGRGLDLVSWVEGLSSSDSVGRVVAVSIGEAGAKNLDGSSFFQFPKLPNFP